MKVSFFQTYIDRLPLLMARSEDGFFKKFTDNFDVNIISLHNVTENVRDYVKNNEIVKNKIILEFNNISYTQCISNLLNVLSDLKCEKFFFYQDDTFSNEIDESNFSDLIDICFNFEYEILSLFHKMSRFKEMRKEILYKTKTFNVYNTNTHDFCKTGSWSFDDSPFICDFKQLKNIFDDTYFSCGDIWSAEKYLNNKFRQKCMNRSITDISFFNQYAVIGNHVHDQHKEDIKTKLNLSKQVVDTFQYYYDNPNIWNPALNKK